MKRTVISCDGCGVEIKPTEKFFALYEIPEGKTLASRARIKDLCESCAPIDSAASTGQ